jgi:hypothetical protein
MFVKKTSKSGKQKIIWRIFISTVGAALILIALINFALYFIGNEAFADISTRRYGGERQGAVNDKRYSWYVDYTFLADNGQQYEGHLTKLGSATSVEVERNIYYFSFAPFINTTQDTAEPNFGQLLMAAVGVFCLVIINRKSRKAI